MIRRSDFKNVNGYNEDFPHAGAEDYDFAIRVRNAGTQTFVDPTNMVYHNESDRVDLIPWLQRKGRAAQTRILAVTLGHEQLAIKAGGIKKKLIPAFYPFRSIILATYHLIPNMALFDKLSFFIINRLVSIYLYKGYFSNK
jgi:GT2 family glycosyltransferase